jgi:hypothetical protein
VDALAAPTPSRRPWRLSGTAGRREYPGRPSCQVMILNPCRAGTDQAAAVRISPVRPVAGLWGHRERTTISLVSDWDGCGVSRRVVSCARAWCSRFQVPFLLHIHRSAPSRCAGLRLQPRFRRNLPLVVFLKICGMMYQPHIVKNQPAPGCQAHGMNRHPEHTGRHRRAGGCRPVFCVPWRYPVPLLGSAGTLCTPATVEFNPTIV